jgi:hypothetical protein
MVHHRVFSDPPDHLIGRKTLTILKP